MIKPTKKEIFFVQLMLGISLLLGVNQQFVDLRVFCFILHSILWEEENLDEYNQIENSIYNFRSAERVILDREYFSLFTDLKQLATNKVSPDSNEAQAFIKKFVALYKQTLSKIENIKIESTNQSEQPNILDPFTEEERIFLKSAFDFVSKLQD